MAYIPLVSVIILNWNGKEVIESCVGSVLNSSYVNIEIIIVDNISTDGSVELMKEKFGYDSRLKIIITERNLPNAMAHNIGMKSAKGELIFLINNDNQVEKDCIKNLVTAMEENSAVYSPKVLLPSGKIDFMGGLMDRWGYGYGRGYKEEDRRQYDGQDFFYAGYWIFKRALLEKAGYFDEEVTSGWDDLDFSWRIRLCGEKIILVPTAIIYHFGSHTVKKMHTRYFRHYHIRKNRVAGLIKNYNLFNLMRFLPGLLFFYFLVFLKELSLDRNAQLAFTSVSAVWWNLKKLPLLVKKRRIVQKCIRCAPDREILRYIYNKSILVDFFLKPKLCGISKN